MNNVESAAVHSMSLTRRFWLINLTLLLLYLWTLTETTTISVSVQPGTCTAHTPERSLTISCSGLYRGSIGLYSRADPIPDFLDGGPMDWLAPASAWKEITVLDANDGLQWRDAFYGSLSSWQAMRGVWRTRFGELRAPSEPAFIVRKEALPDLRPAFQIEARLHRPYDSAGLVLLQPESTGGSRSGWAFVATASERRGEWWRWQDGQLVEPIAGIPFQKPALAQLQSLLRRVLNAHHAALLLMGAGWLLGGVWQRFARRADTASVRRLLLATAWRARIVCALLVLLVFSLSLHIAGDVLERIPHVQDSVTYLFQARTLARDQLSAPAPPVPEAFEQEFLLVREGRWFGKYPPGYPALLAVGVLAGAPWLVSPWLAALTVPLLFVLGRRLFPASPSTALLCAALPLASPFFLFMSGSHMAHSAELFWMALFMVLWLGALRKPARRYLAIGAGLALGALFLTRQLSAVAGALPFLMVTLLSPWVRRSRITRARMLRQLLRTGATALPFLLLLLVHQWALTGDALQDPRLLFWEYDHLGFGQDIGEGQNAFQLTMTPAGMAQVWYSDPSQPPRGHSVARGLHNTQQNWLALERDLFGWLPALTFSLIWLAFLLQAPRWQDYALLFLFATLLGAYLFYWADGISYGPRYFFVALPALFLLTARGAHALSRWLEGRSGSLAVASLLLILVGGAALFSIPSYLEHYRGYNYVSRDRLSLIERQTQKPALVLVDPGVDWWHYGEVFSANSPWLDGPIVVARDLGPETNRRLLAHFADRHAYTLSGNELQPFQRE